MNYKPFSLVEKGHIFNMIEREGIALMKTGPNSAVYLQGFWAGAALRSRGEIVSISAETCVIEPQEQELTLTIAKVDPIDPRRKFWKDGDQVKVGKNSSSSAMVNIFAGLFIYHGMGSGNYYSATNEVFGADRSWAEVRADKEGVPFVYHDSFEVPGDANLTNARARAVKVFESKIASDVRAA